MWDSTGLSSKAIGLKVPSSVSALRNSYNKFLDSMNPNSITVSSLEGGASWLWSYLWSSFMPTFGSEGSTGIFKKYSFLELMMTSKVVRIWGRVKMFLETNLISTMNWKRIPPTLWWLLKLKLAIRKNTSKMVGETSMEELEKRV